MQNKICVFLLFLVFSLGACVFDYDKTMIADDLAEEIPNTIIKNFSQTMVRNNKPKYRIEAKEAGDFEKINETVFKNVNFKEFDRDGNVVTEGNAEKGKLFTETENVELWGNLDFFSYNEEASIKGDYLFWDNEESVLRGNGEDTVSIEKTSGSAITGKGFNADSKTKKITFSISVEGSWADE